MKCPANPTADPPQDCNWPFCGCDEKATKVIEVLVECGWREPPPPSAKAQWPLVVMGIEPLVRDLCRVEARLEIRDEDKDAARVIRRATRILEQADRALVAAIRMFRGGSEYVRDAAKLETEKYHGLLNRSAGNGNGDA